MTTKHKMSDADYAEMAASYEAEPPTADEVVSVEVSPVLRMGRPRKGVESAGRTPSMAVRLPDELRDGLAVLARVDGVSPSELVRRAVAEYLGNHTVAPRRRRMAGGIIDEGDRRRR